MKCTIGGRTHRHLDLYVRQASVQGETLPANTEVWIKTADLPLNEKWDSFLVYDHEQKCSLTGWVTITEADRAKNRIKVITTRSAVLSKVRVLLWNFLPGERPPREDNPETLGDGNGSTPRAMP